MVAQPVDGLAVGAVAEQPELRGKGCFVLRGVHKQVKVEQAAIFGAEVGAEFGGGPLRVAGDEGAHDVETVGAAGGVVWRARHVGWQEAEVDGGVGTVEVALGDVRL